MRLLVYGACASLALSAGGCGREELRIGWAEATDRSLELTYSHGEGQKLGDADVRVALDEPLGSRKVIDGSTGRPPESHPPGRPLPPGIPCKPPP